MVNLLAVCVELATIENFTLVRVMHIKLDKSDRVIYS